MTSIKVKFRPSTVANHEGSIYYQIIRDKNVRQILTGYRVFPAEWDAKRSMVSTSTTKERSAAINTIRRNICRDLELLAMISRRLDAKCVGYSASDVVNTFHRYTSEYTVFTYMRRKIDALKQNGKIRTSETYAATLSSFQKFRNNEDMMLCNLNSDVMEAFEAWHLAKGNSLNTISFYNRILRAVYNRAFEEEIVDNCYPFRHVYTGIEKTVKRALPLKQIKKIKSLNLSLNPTLEYARDMFMLSFMLRGMSLVDMAYLRKTDLDNGYVVYRRRKTGQRLSIAWTKDMQSILDKYPNSGSDYLLPIIRSSGTSDRNSYRNAGTRINSHLKTIASMVGISSPLTLYVARHSWASAAKSKGIPISVISEGMGHDSETTTLIYLASLDTSVVDKANALILASI